MTETPNEGNGAAVREQPNSVKIAQNAKGEISFEVKAYGETILSASVDAWNEFKGLRTQIEADKAARKTAQAKAQAA